MAEVIYLSRHSTRNTAMPKTETKQCSDCDEVKPVGDFYSGRICKKCSLSKKARKYQDLKSNEYGGLF